MRFLYSLALLCLVIPAWAKKSDPSTLTSEDIAKLANRTIKILHKCPQLHHGSESQISVRNETETFLDKDEFSKMVRAGLPGAASGPGKAYEIILRVRETKTEVAKHTKAVYTVIAEVKQAEETLCSKSLRFEKDGDR